MKATIIALVYAARIATGQTPTAACVASFAAHTRVGQDELRAPAPRQIVGAVTDSAGQGIAASTVRIGDAPDIAVVGRSTVSNPSGIFRFEGLVPGRYSVTVTQAGYFPAAATLVVNTMEGATSCVALKKNAGSDVWISRFASSRVPTRGKIPVADSIALGRAVGAYFSAALRGSGTPIVVANRTGAYASEAAATIDRMQATPTLQTSNALPRYTALQLGLLKFWQPDSVLVRITVAGQNCGTQGLNAWRRDTTYIFARQNATADWRVDRKVQEQIADGVCQADLRRPQATVRLESETSRLMYGAVMDLQQSILDTLLLRQARLSPQLQQSLRNSAFLDSAETRDRSNGCDANRADPVRLDPAWCTFVGTRTTVRVERIASNVQGVDGSSASVDLIAWPLSSPMSSTQWVALTANLIRAQGEWRVVQVTRTR